MFRLATVLLFASFLLPAADDLDSELKRVIEAYAIVEQNAADPVNSEQLFYEGAIPGLLRTLDPHSVFFDPDQFQQLHRLETSTEKGFGTVVSILPGRVIVLQTLPGTPSAKAGLAPGDDIVSINGYQISRLTLDEIPELLGQARRQQCQMEVRRSGTARMLHFVLTPEEMQQPSVDRAYFVGAGVGYIRVASFEEKTPAQMKEAIEKLGGDRLAALVIDLRNNPGGLVDAAVESARLFLQPGQKVVTVRGRHMPEKTEVVPETAKPYRFKLAILLNEKTASASEIFSGAMQDHDRATIIGQPSFGKGLVQSVIPLNEGTGVALTTALYFTPSGRSIQKPLDAAQFELGAATAGGKAHGEFHTDEGRTVTGGGGIQPDFLVYPLAMNRFRAVLDASGSFTNFATEYLARHKIEEDFEVTPEILDDFHLYLAQRNIQPGVGEWSSEREFIANRLKTEIFDQAFGVAKGDEIEAQRDPLILKALDVFGS